MNKRTYRKTRMERNRKARRFRLYGLIAFLIILSIFSFRFLEKNKGINEAASLEDLTKEEISEIEHIITPSERNKEIGDIQSIIEYGTNGLIAAHYPIFHKTNIDLKTQELINGYIEKFKNEIESHGLPDKSNQYELNIDYEINSVTNNIISITFNILQTSSYMAHPIVEVETKSYDLASDLDIELSNIMDGEYLKFISDKSENHFSLSDTYKDNIDSSIFREGIYPSTENYSNFILKEDSIVFIFNKYQLFSGNFGMPSVEISYSDLEDYIKPNLFQALTIEENPSEVEVGVEEKPVDITVPNRVIDPNKPMIALSFDDGPNEKTTIPILDTLKEYDSVATFFILGNRVSSNVDILERMIEEGNEIGNHSYSHKELTKLSNDALREQILLTQNAVNDHISLEPKLMRPTYGSYNDNLKSQVQMPLILWSVDPMDWKSRNAKAVTDHILENVKDGDIVLMHDIYDSTAEAVESLVPKLIQMGYQLVTVSELFEARGEVLEGGQIYNHMHKK